MNVNRILKIWLAALLLTLTACSDDKKEPAAPPAQQTRHDKHIPPGGEASSPVKTQFIQAFAQKCVDRELKNAVNPDVDAKRAQDSCGCIAKRIADDLAEVDAEKYLQQHEDTQTLEIKFDQAAYFCLQNKPLPKGPRLTGRPQS